MDGSGSSLEAEDLALLHALGQELFPQSSMTTLAMPTLDEEIRNLTIRRTHGRSHAWTADNASQTAASAAHRTAASAAAPDTPMAAETAPINSPSAQHEQRIPRETDVAWLWQTVSIKDALLKQMEAALLLPPPDQTITVGLSRRAQALVANARRREAVLGAKLKAVSKELDAFRVRELKAAQINAGLRRRLRAALTDLDAVTLRREVRTLRADLRAALDREALLQRELLRARERIEEDGAAMRATEAAATELRRTFDYVRGVAFVHGQARTALGDDWQGMA
jgi:hypothetical protein